MKIFKVNLLVAGEGEELDGRRLSAAVSDAIDEKVGIKALRILIAEVEEMTDGDLEEALAAD